VRRKGLIALTPVAVVAMPCGDDDGDAGGQSAGATDAIRSAAPLEPVLGELAKAYNDTQTLSQHGFSP
jgi:hypothetical protein